MCESVWGSLLFSTFCERVNESTQALSLMLTQCLVPLSTRVGTLCSSGHVVSLVPSAVLKECFGGKTTVFLIFLI